MAANRSYAKIASLVLGAGQGWRDRELGAETQGETGEIGSLVPGRDEILAKSRGLVSFCGESSSLVRAPGQISKFGTCESCPGESRPGISSDPRNQIAEVGRNRGTKPRFLPEFHAKRLPRIPPIMACQELAPDNLAAVTTKHASQHAKPMGKEARCEIAAWALADEGAAATREATARTAASRNWEQLGCSTQGI